MERREFVRAALLGSGAVVLGGTIWRGLANPLPPTPPGPYGPLLEPDHNGIRLPAGFSGRVLARSGEPVPGTSYTWHPAPDGGACFPDGDGWVYVSNSEVPSTGGVGVLRFDRDGTVAGAHRILDGTSRNCAGGATPWDTWLSCEEVARGHVWETYPRGRPEDAVRRDAMGRFKHEAAAVDPERRCVYLTEDEGDGCFYRFVPTVWPYLAAGRLEVLVGGKGVPGRVGWAPVPDPAAATRPTREQVPGAKRFDGGEGCVYGADTAWFTTKGDHRVWRFDAASDTLDLAYDDSLVDGRPALKGPDNITRAGLGHLFVAEDRGNMEICLITADGHASPFVRLKGHGGSEVTGPAFSPDGTRLYFSSQRGTSGAGITYEVRGPFRA